MHTHAFIHTNTRAGISLHTQRHPFIYAYCTTTHTQTHTYLHTCRHIGTMLYTQSGIHAGKQINTNTHRHACMHADTYLHTYKHAYTHTERTRGINTYTHPDRQAESARQLGYKHILRSICIITPDMIPGIDAHTYMPAYTYEY